MPLFSQKELKKQNPEPIHIGFLIRAETEVPKAKPNVLRF
jgi:hypothetical protein